MEKELEEFLLTTNEIYGLYLDSTTAFREWNKTLAAGQLEVSGKQGISIDELDKIAFGYVENDEERDKGNFKYLCTQGQVKERTARDGNNHKMMADLCVVLIFQYWEYYRGKLQDRTKKEITSDLMGDLMYLRRSVIHNRGIANKDIKKCKVLTWFKEGEVLDINEVKFNEIIGKIRKEILELNKKYFT